MRQTALLFLSIFSFSVIVAPVEGATNPKSQKGVALKGLNDPAKKEVDLFSPNISLEDALAIIEKSRSTKYFEEKKITIEQAMAKVGALLEAREDTKEDSPIRGYKKNTPKKDSTLDEVGCLKYHKNLISPLKITGTVGRHAGYLYEKKDPEGRAIVEEWKKIADAKEKRPYEYIYKNTAKKSFVFDFGVDDAGDHHVCVIKRFLTQDANQTANIGKSDLKVPQLQNEKIEQPNPQSLPQQLQPQQIRPLVDNNKVDSKKEGAVSLPQANPNVAVDVSKQNNKPAPDSNALNLLPSQKQEIKHQESNSPVVENNRSQNTIPQILPNENFEQQQPKQKGEEQKEVPVQMNPQQNPVVQSPTQDDLLKNNKKAQNAQSSLNRKQENLLTENNLQNSKPTLPPLPSGADKNN